MIESNCETKWSQFESSGRISDYLEYKGITTKNYSNIKGEQRIVDDDSERSGNIGTHYR